MLRPRRDHIHSGYHIRLLACTAATLLILIGAVHFWPSADGDSGERRTYRTSDPEAIHVEEIVPTQQLNTPPAPPAPPIPILVPDDNLLDDPDLDFSDSPLLSKEPGEDLSAAQGDADDDSYESSGLTVGPKTVRFVEPEYTREARRRRIRAELVVRVLVDSGGRVEHSEIVERFLLDKNGTSRTPVEILGYGLEEAALSAADRWMFRPAQKNGEPVASHTELTFTFGIDA